MNIAPLSDDELRRVLFDRLVQRLDAVSERVYNLRVKDTAPMVFSISKYGDMLMLKQGDGTRLLSGEVEWKTLDHNEPWRFTVSRASDPSQLEITPGAAGLDRCDR